MKSGAGSCSRSTAGWMIQVGAGCCCPRFIPGDDSGVQHPPRWADGGSCGAGKPGPCKNTSRGVRWGSIYSFKRQNVVMDTKLTLNPLGGGRDKKEWALLSQQNKICVLWRWYKPEVQSITVPWITWAQGSLTGECFMSFGKLIKQGMVLPLQLYLWSCSSAGSYSIERVTSLSTSSTISKFNHFTHICTGMAYSDTDKLSVPHCTCWQQYNLSQNF